MSQIALVKALKSLWIIVLSSSKFQFSIQVNGVTMFEMALGHTRTSTGTHTRGSGAIIFATVRGHTPMLSRGPSTWGDG